MKKINLTKTKKQNLYISLLFLVFFIILMLSSYNLIKYVLDAYNTNNQINIVQNTTPINDVSDSENTDVINSSDKSNLYNYYSNLNLIDVDFDKLKNTNADTRGWIKVPGTNINYPFVQASDNEYYLNHSFDKSYNSAGWVFADYRNDFEGKEKNTILYGHGRLDKTMFGTLKNVLKSDWLNDTDNHIIKVSTEYENTLWQVFSVYHIPTNNDYIQTDFASREEFLDFANKLMERSVYDFNTSVSENDRILTLSTCYHSSEKLVLHAKLVKREVR